MIWLIVAGMAGMTAVGGKLSVTWDFSKFGEELYLPNDAMDFTPADEHCIYLPWTRLMCGCHPCWEIPSQSPCLALSDHHELIMRIINVAVGFIVLPLKRCKYGESERIALRKCDQCATHMCLYLLTVVAFVPDWYCHRPPHLKWWTVADTFHSSRPLLSSWVTKSSWHGDQWTIWIE